MSFTELDLDNLSALARINIAPEEKQKMLADMQAIIGYVSEINEVQGELVRGEGDIFNVVRNDAVTNETGSNTETLLSESPAVVDGYVKVEQVLK
ncbi:MAG: Asp-tRNA(Asn)/Glu-tRNA(Gln) amidotransferase subunit GatC [Candidatus Paceibacterota bacterium]|jgi:aspartyl/glutamyl-tRNA(Asn/Gln) amidotransferase C subunit